MSEEWKKRWDDRYAETGFAYGTEPNEYLRQQLANLKPGSILFPAEGEGRNPVYAATMGWKTTAFDISNEGRNKAMKLAAARGVLIDYKVGELHQLAFREASFDAVALIYAHFPAALKPVLIPQILTLLKPGGTLLFEAFSRKNLEYVARNPQVGGPKEPDMLYTTTELETYLAGYHFTELAETEVTLQEGLYHNGVGCVVRCVATKPA